MADFQSHLAEFEQNAIAIYALSTDSEEKAREMVNKHGLGYPVMFGVDGPATAEAWGSYYEQRRNILQATAFILLPDHSIASATYSTGPVGRLVADDALRAVATYKRQAAAT